MQLNFIYDLSSPRLSTLPVFCVEFREAESRLFSSLDSSQRHFVMEMFLFTIAPFI